MTYKLVMAVTCFGMMAGDAIAQERGGREQGEGAQRRERPSGAAGEQRRERGQGAERRQRPSGAAGEQRQGAERRQRPSGAAGEQSRERGQGAERRQRPSGSGRERGSRGSQFGGRGGQGGPGGFLRMFPVMAALDSDGNGEISSEEIKGAVAALKKLDKNKDGKLTEDELRPNFGGRGGSQGGPSGQRPSRGGEGRGGQRPGRPSPGE